MNMRVDARGLDCPKPVIETKKALERTSDKEIVTIVDNEVAKENVVKLVKSMNYKYHVECIDGEYYINIFKDMLEEIKETKLESKKPILDMVVVIGSDTMGEGDRTLGEILIKGYVYTLSEMDKLPKAVLMLNSGVKLATEGSEVVEDLRKLEANGVDILSCGTCLDYYNVKDQLIVGGITNMYTIVEYMNYARNTVRV